LAAYKMMVLSNPMPGREAECDHWYQHVHLADVVKLPGFVSAQRYHVAQPMAQANPYQFLAIYDIETDDIDQAISNLVTAAEKGIMTISDDLDRANSYAVVYEASGALVRELK